MTMTIEEIIIEVLKFLGEAALIIVPVTISAFVSRYQMKKQLALEAKKVETDTGKVSAGYTQLVEDLKEEIARIKSEYSLELSGLKTTIISLQSEMAALTEKALRCSKKIGRLQTGIVALTEQLKKAGMQPAYVVAEDDLKTDNGYAHGVSR